MTGALAPREVWVVQADPFSGPAIGLFLRYQKKKLLFDAHNSVGNRNAFILQKHNWKLQVTVAM